MKCFFLITTILTFFLGSSFANEQTSETNHKLKKFLSNFEGSDAHPKDGILTQSELYTFLLRKIPSSATSNSAGLWGQRLKRFNKETNGAADTKPKDGILTKSEVISYVGRR